MKDQAKMNVPSLKATAASSGSSESTDFELVHENMHPTETEHATSAQANPRHDLVSLKACPQGKRTRKATAHSQSGPKTPKGKARAAQNALRGGLFVARAVNDDEAQKLQSTRQAIYALTEGSDIDQHPLLFSLVEGIAQIQMRIARVQAVEAEALNVWYAHKDIRKRFCVAAGLLSIGDDIPPDWYFEESMAPAKLKAMHMREILSQAQSLAEALNPEEALETSADLSILRSYLLEQWAQADQALFTTLSQAFETRSPHETVRALLRWLDEHDHWTLSWADHHESYSAIVARLKAEVQSEILTEPGRQKLLTALERQLVQRIALFEQMRTRAWSPEALTA